MTITISAAGPTDIASLLASADALIRTDAAVFDADATNLGWAASGGPAYCAALVADGDDFAVSAYADNTRALAFYARRGFEVRSVILELDL